MRARRVQRLFLCMPSGVFVDFQFDDADPRTCTFAMAFKLKAASATYVLGEPQVDETRAPTAPV